ncbi:MAG: electron transfer flavoprotein subunit beta/FixA family protein [Clostridia bacterium]|nr:electron transfer flavoprotein subunit beta/FixA family protein [Clostridia bacterium]
MKLICLVKFVPDVDSYQVDFENSALIREKARLQLNPDDVCAVAFALKVKATHPDTTIEVVTMAPSIVTPHLFDLLRIGVDQGTLISDRIFAGSDTYATATILASYLATCDYDAILTGTHAIDGDTSHIPAQLGALLDKNQMSGIIRIDENLFSRTTAVFDVETEDEFVTYEMALPAILSLVRDCPYKLPYASRKDMARDVSGNLRVITSQDLSFNADEVGTAGSKTRVAHTFTREYDKKGRVVVQTDAAGVEYVYQFLKEKSFI